MMISRKPERWPSPFDWAPGLDPLRLAILERSRLDVAIFETSANRGDRIDTYLRRAHVPEDIIEAGHGYWCGAWTGCMLIDAGAQTPRDFGDCDAWLPYLLPCGWRDLPGRAQPGDVVLYGVPGNGQHIGLVWRVSPMVITLEGNRGVAGDNTNNGVCVGLGPVTRRDVLGILRPVTAARP